MDPLDLMGVEARKVFKEFKELMAHKEHRDYRVLLVYKV